MKPSQTTLTLAIIILATLPLTLAQPQIINLSISQPLPNFIAGETATTSFNFNYPNLSQTYPDQMEDSPMVLIVNINSNDLLHPVWEGDFVVNGSMITHSWFSYDEYSFDCVEKDFSLSCPYIPYETNSSNGNGTFYCTNDDFLEMDLGSDSEVSLNFKSHYALWPGSYNYSVSLWYPEIVFTELVIEPGVPDGAKGWYVSSPVFSLNNSESLGMFYQWDSGESFVYDGEFGLEDIVNPVNVSAGILELNYWANLSCGFEDKQTEIIYVDLTDPVITGLVPEDGGMVYGSNSGIEVYLDEVYQSNSGINGDSLIMIVDGVNVELYADIDYVGALDAKVNYFAENLLDGLHEVYIYVEDNAGRSSNRSWNFIVNGSDVFDFEVHSPSELIYDSKRVEFNISSSERLEKIEYINWNDNRPRWKRLCRNCDEYGFEKRKTKSLKEGENNLGIRGIDEFGRVEEMSVSVFIDSKKPKISSVKPRRNSFVNGSEFYVKYTEDNLKEVRLFYGVEGDVRNEVLSGCVGGRNQECVVDVNLSVFDGHWIEYWFEVSDDINVVESRKTRVRVDVVAPVILNVDDFYDVDDKYVYFNLSIDEDNFDVVEYIDWESSRPRWRKLCSRLKDGLCVKKKSFKNGLHDVEVRVVDDAGNWVVERFGFDV